MASSSLVWPPFLPSPDHGLMNFPLEKCLVFCHEFSDGSSNCGRDSPPCPSGIISSSAFLFSIPLPELTNVCHSVFCESAQILHQCKRRFCWLLYLHHWEGRRQSSDCQVSLCSSQKLSQVLFWTQDVFIKSSQHFGCNDSGYTLDRSKLVN